MMIIDTTQDHKIITVKDLVLSLYKLTQATSIIDNQTGKEISVQELQDIFYNEVEQLADILGINLEGESEVPS